MLSEDAVKKQLAASIREARLRKGLSAAGLARSADVSRQTVLDAENGTRKPRQESLRRIAEALGTTPEALITPGEGKASTPAYWRPDPGSPLGKKAESVEALEGRLQPVFDAFVASYLPEDRRAAFLSQLELWGELDFRLDAWNMVTLMRKWLGEVDELLGDRDDFNIEWHHARISAPDYVEPEWPEEYR